MSLQKLYTLTHRYEDPRHPLLGPTIKGLFLFGLWQTGSKLRTVTYNAIHYSTFVFVCSQIVDLFTVRNDLNKILNNMSLTALSIVCVAKCFSYVFRQREWRILVESISIEELRQINKRDSKILKLMEEYKKYVRVVTYMYWVLVFFTNLLLIITPLLKYASSKTYREEIKSGEEPLPQILCSWFPFDSTKMPGYLWGVCVHIIMGSQGSGVIAVYDTNAVAIMSYLKGQMRVLREKCRDIFEEEDISRDDVMDRIRECHRHHNVLVEHYKMFDALLSPIMFMYVLVCSITICCSVVQFTSSEATTSQKLWVIQYSTGLVLQLFLYCWHSNEVAIETKELDRGIYESDWWRGDEKIRRQVLLLAGKMNVTLILNAGPYTTLSVPTFIEILKGSYSFFTLFSQMQDNK